MTSIPDWDWETANYTFDAVDKIEGTSSLCFNGNNCILAKHAAAQNLKNGMVETYLKMGDPAEFRYINTYIHFYNQAPLGSANMDNCYRFRIRIYETWIAEFVVEEVVGGTVQRTFTLTQTQAWMDWQKKRFIWYIKNGILYVYVDHWTGTEWVKDTDVIAITNPRWLDSATKRVGLAGGGIDSPAAYIRFDATRIYEIIP